MRHVCIPPGESVSHPRRLWFVEQAYDLAVEALEVEVAILLRPLTTLTDDEACL